MQTKVNITSVAFAPLWGSGTTILRELVYDTSSGSKVLTYSLYYGYDESGSISHVTVKSGTTSATFYYVKNLQGDVTAITDSNGTALVQYRYDAWGDWNWTVTSGLTGLSQYIAYNNPFRYRGYYYDDETGFYYLNSRYYDPEVGRFLNADGYVSTGQGLTSYNMYAYCGNNPVMYTDSEGDFPVIIKALIAIALPVIIPIANSLRLMRRQVQGAEATEEQIQAAYDAADEAQLDARPEDETVDIAIDTQRTIDAVDPVAYKYYYRRLHERARKKAEEEGIGTSNLMSVLHIAWEFELHALAHKAGHPSAEITNLNYEETVWTMIARALG